jgi:hypothetical protein
MKFLKIFIYWLEKNGFEHESLKYKKLVNSYYDAKFKDDEDSYHYIQDMGGDLDAEDLPNYQGPRYDI